VGLSAGVDSTAEAAGKTASTQTTTKNFDDDALAPQPTSAPSRAPIVLDDSVWTPMFRGAEYRHIVLRQPRKMQIHVVRIDLTTKGLRFFVTPVNAEGKYAAMTVSSFVKTFKPRVAINASAFSPVTDDEGDPQVVEGLCVSEGKLQSKYKKNLSMLLIRKDNHVSIVDGSEAPDLTDVRSAVAGFAMVLKDHVNLSKNDKTLHPRTAAGVSGDGKFLFLMVVDGRQPLFSEGASTHDVAEILNLLGAADGMNFDGGGSTAMVKLDKEGKAVQVDSPIHRGVPGRERPDANHLGVFLDE
jgi:hypothetical protein